MSDARPKVSIGLPVYNGEKFLTHAIESLLSQSYANIELIISDNCSIDGSAEIAHAAAQRDPRVSFYQNPTNIGAANNFNRVFNLASGKYFMWAAHDDLWHPDFIAKCVATLERLSSIILCATNIRFIDHDGEIVKGRGMRAVGGRYNQLNTVRMDLRRRVSELTGKLNWYAIYGLIRTDGLKKTRLFREAYGTDVLLLMELLLQGETLILPEQLFSYRIQRKSAADQLRIVTGREADKPQLSPYTELAKNLLSVIEQAALPETIKNQLAHDLIENISRRNRRWQRLIAKENPAAKSSNRWEQARNVRRLFIAPSSEGTSIGPLQTSFREIIYRLGAVGVHARRAVDKFTG
jgi:glycosyltransferase involved in cell wall biosynthesis